MNSDKVMKRILRGAPEDITEQEIEFLTRDAESKLSAGWDEEDVIRFFRSTENINPELDEDIALARMRKISEKYDGKKLKKALAID